MIVRRSEPALSSIFIGLFSSLSILKTLKNSVNLSASSTRSLGRALRVVGSSGLEPPTSRLSGARSNHLSYEPIKLFRCISSLSPIFYGFFAAGGDDGIRTHDPLLAGQVLSQLSYTPV